MKTHQHIGINILNYRSYQGLTQQQIANFLGVTREFISLIETGKRDISISNLNKLADLFGIELSELLEEDPKIQKVNFALAFRSDDSEIDLESIASFRRIVMNYLKMETLKNETDN